MGDMGLFGFVITHRDETNKENYKYTNKYYLFVFDGEKLDIKVEIPIEGNINNVPTRSFISDGYLYFLCDRQFTVIKL